MSIGVTRAGLLFVAALAGGSAVLMFGRHQAALGTSLLTLTCWTLLLGIRPELAPFVGGTVEALVRTRLIFAGLAAIFFLLTAFGGVLELPRVLCPHYPGVVVGFDPAAPIERRWSYPLVEFEDASGRRQVISTWSAQVRTPRPGASLTTFRLGDRLPVAHYGGAYHGVTRNEYRVLGAVVGLPGAAFVLCAGLALAAHSRLAAHIG